MRMYYKLWTGKDSYFLPTKTDGLLSPEILERKYPILSSVPCLIKTDKGGITLYEITELSVARDNYDIPDEMGDEKAIQTINEKMNAPQSESEPEPTAEERIAAAMEFQNTLTLLNLKE